MMKKVFMWLLVCAIWTSLTPNVFEGTAYANSPAAVKLLFAKVEKGCPSGCYEFSGGIEVNNIGYQKEVYVHYTTGNGQWSDIPASYGGKTEGNLEGWSFKAAVADTGNPIQFAIKYIVNGQTYWDNNGNQNYRIGGSSAPDRVLAKSFLSLDNAEFGASNAFSGRIYLKNITHHKKVTIRYTSDNWATYKEKDAVYTSPLPKSNNSLEYWDFNVDVAPNVKAVKYVIGYVANGVTYWDNNFQRDHQLTAKQPVPAALTLTPQSQTAVVGTNAIVRLRLTDSSNNPVNGQAISLSASGNASIPPTVTTNASGEADVAVTSQQAGTVVVTGTVNGYSVSGTAQITFAPDIHTSVLTMTPQNQSTAAGTNANIRLRLTDRFNNPIKGQMIKLAATGNGSLPSSVVTNASGEADVAVTSQQAGTVVVTGTVNGYSISSTAQIQFTPDNTVTLKLTPQSTTAVVGSRPTVRVRLTDKYNNPVRQVKITMSATGSGFVPTELTTDNNGEGAFLVGGVQTGIAYISAKASGYSVTASTQIEFTPDRGSAVLTLVPESESAVAGNGTAIRVRLTDKYNNPIGQASVGLSATGGAVIPAATTTNSNGEAIVTATSQQAGSLIITGTFQGKSVSTEVRIVPAGPASLTILQDSQEAVAGTSRAIRFIVLDKFDNRIPNSTISLRTIGNAEVPASITTDGNGEAVASVRSEKAGIVLIHATVDRSSVIGAARVEFTADVPAALTLVPDNDRVVVGTNVVVKIALKDRFNNPVASTAIQLTATGGATLPATVTTDASGEAVISVTSQQAGTAVVTGRVGSSSVSGTAQIQFLPDDQSVILTLAPESSMAVAGTSTELRIVLTDKLNNPIAGAAVQLSAEGNNVVIPAAVTTNANGEAVAAVTTEKAGTVRITAVYNGAEAAAQVLWLPADPASVTITPATGSAAAGTNVAVHFQVIDRFGNPVGNSLIDLTAVGNTSIPASIATDENGEAQLTVTSQGVGSVVVTAAVQGSQVTGTFTIAFTAAEPAIVTLTPPLATAVVGTSRNVHIKVTDRFGNPVTQSAVSLTATGNASLPASVTTNSSGEAVVAVTSERAGTAVITAAVPGSSASGTARIQFTPDAPARIIFQSPLPQIIVDDVSFVKVTLVDRFGNGIPSHTLKLTATKNMAVPLSTATNANGEAIIILGNPVAETAVVTATAANGVTGSASITSRY
ncbi:Ig-like domain-containing protein [Paenibacillus plantiphilus]|nr:Ig-like domain-containing protein [Paenibacillus plantiphilus]